MASPQNVGIRAVQLYFPKNYVDQVDLEKFDGASAGKYTKGLGQLQMAFCCDNEDVNSIALTVTSELLRSYKIDPSSIGFLAVGTETLVDKSKSVKTVLMPLFGDNTDIEGVDVKNACYGGTQALLNAVDWVVANYATEQRLAIAVMADIAVYEPGPARCTGGAGAIAVLVGPDAPIVFERGLRACHMTNTADFYKPVNGLASEYPVVDGSLSLKAYLSSVDACYAAYLGKTKKIACQERSHESFDAVLFHCPFAKLVQKAYARIYFEDFKAKRTEASQRDSELLAAFLQTPTDDTYLSRDFQAASVAASQSAFETQVNANLAFNRRLGNSYTPSLYVQLVNLLARLESPADVEGKKALLFSYGSGLASAMFSLAFDASSGVQASALAEMMKVSREASHRLDQRVQHRPEEYTEVMKTREVLTNAQVPIVPFASQNGITQHLFPGSYYLKYIDEKHRRLYEVVSRQEEDSGEEVC